MQELEKILEEIEIKIAGSMGKKREGLLEAQDIIRKHMNDGWIPAEEKPSEDGFYVTTMNGALVDQEEPFVGLAEFKDGEWFDGDDVVAWRHLPEPYRTESKTGQSNWRADMMRKFDRRSRQ